MVLSRRLSRNDFVQIFVVPVYEKMILKTLSDNRDGSNNAGI